MRYFTHVSVECLIHIKVFIVLGESRQERANGFGRAVRILFLRAERPCNGILPDKPRGTGEEHRQSGLRKSDQQGLCYGSHDFPL